MKQEARDTVNTLFGYLRSQGDTDYIGEAVSQLEHSLQSAALASNAGSDDELILAALLHDVGRFLPESTKLPRWNAEDGTYLGTASHDSVGQRYLASIGFPRRICEVVGAHVWAKRYLCATEPGYWESLSKSSKATLIHQGGAFTPAQVEAAMKDPWLEDKLSVRRWDDLAKVAGASVPGLDAYEEMAIRSLSDPITLHGRTYQLPTRPTVVICVDGFDPTYLEAGIASGILPTLKRISETGFHATADVTMPTFTNPNNVSIITGAPTAVHGIAGNYFLDRETGKEQMVVDDSLLVGSTILAEMANRGVRVAAVTAKDKLRRILKHGLQKHSICFSAQDANDVTLKWLGKKSRPSQYSGELSLFVLDAGIEILKKKEADLYYLTLSDYIQHKHAPGEKESDEFLAALDDKVRQMLDLGAVVALTGDHGMSAKSKADGTPDILFLQDELEAKFGVGCARVICPITDPFVRHHGALGSFVRVHIMDDSKTGDMIDLCKTFPQVQVALAAEEACERFEMPLDREGDFVVVSTKHSVIGSKKEEHDLSNLGEHPLRSHGGLSELQVPLLMSEGGTSRPSDRKRWRNFDIFDLVLNYGQ